jgi:hypothetical protein
MLPLQFSLFLREVNKFHSVISCGFYASCSHVNNYLKCSVIFKHCSVYGNIIVSWWGRNRVEVAATYCIVWKRRSTWQSDRDLFQHYLKKELISSRYCLCWWGESVYLTSGRQRTNVHPPDDIRIWRATVEYYWQGKSKNGWESSVPVPLNPQQIPCRMTRPWTGVSTARGRKIATWAWARL